MDSYNGGYLRSSLVFEDMLLRQKSQLLPIVMGLGQKQCLLETETRSCLVLILWFLQLFFAAPTSPLDKAPQVWGLLPKYSRMGVESSSNWPLKEPAFKETPADPFEGCAGSSESAELTHPWTQWSLSEQGYSYTDRLNKCLLTRGCLVWEYPALCVITWQLSIISTWVFVK